MRIVGRAHLRRHAVLVGAATLSIGTVGGVLPSLGANASATPRSPAPVLRMINVPKYPGVLGNSKSHSLYLLSDEVGGKLHCTGQCLQTWVPLWISKGAHASVGPGVKGKWGTVARKLSSASTKYQLTYNSFPVYTFAGDSAPKQANGEGIKFASGVNWYLIKASATTASSSPMKKASGGSGGGGGGGW